MRDKYLTVTALTKYIKRKLDVDPHLRTVWLRGEISNFKHHSRGHMYLTIKDEQARIQAVMFLGNNRHLTFTPENGMNVLVKGEISVFEGQGQYQLYIKEMEPDGIGSLYLAFEQLKERLRIKGYFKEEHKKTLPAFPSSIGVVTSPAGAAVRDVITTIKRRYPLGKITVIPVLVQGEHAAESIKKGIELANTKGDFDVLIVGRGGGSIEELWSFNEEIVAEAIYNSRIPIISAVGHETDITISDYVADYRAPTPTGAAEIAVPSQMELIEKVNSLTNSLHQYMVRTVEIQNQLLRKMSQSYAFRYPEQLIRQKEQELDKLNERLEWLVTHQIRQKSEQIMRNQSQLALLHPKQLLVQSSEKWQELRKKQEKAMVQIIEQKSIKLTQMIEKLTLLNPLEIMKRGYAIPFAETGEIIRKTEQVKVDDSITLNLSEGQLRCKVLEIKEEQQDE